MPRRPGGVVRPLRLHLGLLVVAALVPMLLMSIVAVVLFDRSQRAATERGAVDTARALASAVDGELSSSVEMLAALAIDATVERGELPAVHERLTRARASQPD